MNLVFSMKKNILILLLTFFCFLLVNKQFQIVKFSIPFFNMPNGYVRVDFINKSGKYIKQITLNNVSCYNIKNNEQKTIVFKHKGEGFYTYQVEFKSGKKLKVNGTYIEQGYFLYEEIKINTTKTKLANIIF